MNKKSFENLKNFWIFPLKMPNFSGILKKTEEGEFNSSSIF